jgi:hypothetical protein
VPAWTLLRRMGSSKIRPTRRRLQPQKGWPACLAPAPPVVVGAPCKFSRGMDEAAYWAEWPARGAHGRACLPADPGPGQPGVARVPAHRPSQSRTRRDPTPPWSTGTPCGSRFSRQGRHRLTACHWRRTGPRSLLQVADWCRELGAILSQPSVPPTMTD